MSEPSSSDRAGSEERTRSPARIALSRLSAAERDDLVAYIDGELPSEDEQRLDGVLSENAVARREVAHLERVYDLLDLLDRPEASEDFTASTMQTIRQERSEEQTSHSPPAFDAGVLLKQSAIAFALTFGAATLAHFAADTSGQIRPEDTPLLERLDALRAVGDPAFLSWLSTDAVRTRLEETADE